MIELLDLEELGVRLRKVDQHVVELLGQRMRLSLQVEEYKRQRKQPIFRGEVEKRRLDEAYEWAARYGLNPEFARSIFYAIIGESCKMQMIQLQGEVDPAAKDLDEEQWHKQLKENLLRLTARCAPTYDEQYSATFYATRLHAEFEQHLIMEVCRGCRGEAPALDLGCATGRVAFMLGNYFAEVVGYDLSPDMVRIARSKYGDAPPNNKKLRFEVADLEECIPQPDRTVALAVMSMGFASDLRLIRKVLREVHRVLVPGGMAFLSFYNAEALLYRWEFIPWPVGLAAEINLQKHCLEVRWAENEVYPIYARPYTLDEINNLMPRGLPILKTTTHPTICSILPDVLFDNEQVRDSIGAIDVKLADENSGAYITVIARKS